MTQKCLKVIIFVIEKKTKLCINNIVKSNIDKSYLLNITYSVILMQNDPTPPISNEKKVELQNMPVV